MAEFRSECDGASIVFQKEKLKKKSHQVILLDVDESLETEVEDEADVFVLFSRPHGAGEMVASNEANQHFPLPADAGTIIPLVPLIEVPSSEDIANAVIQGGCADAGKPTEDFGMEIEISSNHTEAPFVHANKRRKTASGALVSRYFQHIFRSFP